MKEYLLFEKYPKLKILDPLPIVNSPTPIFPLKHTSKALGASIWIKNDGITMNEYGGNKPRKLAFILRDVIKQSKTTVITQGGLGSNHCLATVVSAKKANLNAAIYLDWQRLNPHVRNNMLADHYFGAEMIYSPNREETTKKIQKRLMEDPNAYFIPTGGSSPLGTVGFVNAAFELAEQIKTLNIPTPDQIYVAFGSGGTCAGLLIGSILAGIQTQIVGVQVYIENEDTVLKLAQETLELLREIEPNIPQYTSKELRLYLKVTAQFFGGEYGITTKEGIEAQKLIQSDGIQLETTYTAKCFSAVVDHCNNIETKSNRNILYWHTFNSLDISSKYSSVDYRQLHSDFHQFFDGTVPFDEEIVNCKEQKSFH